LPLQTGVVVVTVVVVTVKVVLVVATHVPQSTGQLSCNLAPNKSSLHVKAFCPSHPEGSGLPLQRPVVVVVVVVFVVAVTVVAVMVLVVMVAVVAVLVVSVVVVPVVKVVVVIVVAMHVSQSTGQISRMASPNTVFSSHLSSNPS
jgi:hypothetical protein